MKNKVFILLLAALVIVGVLPLIANSVLIDDVLLSQQNIYRNQELSKTLESYEANLKKLSKQDPSNQGVYRQQFHKIQDLKLIYGDDPYFSETIRATTSKYFFIIFGVALALALIIGSFLSLKVNSLYIQSFDALTKEKEKSRYLNDIAKWQEVAQMLAHEIRRPLQPIRTWISQLRRSVPGELVDEASHAIDQEVLFLSEMVSEFSEFANVPKPKLEIQDGGEFIGSFVVQYKDIWPEVCLSFSMKTKVAVAIDPKIFRTLFTNLVENAVEANPGKEIDVKFTLSSLGDTACISVFNSGVTLSLDERERVFDLYFSTKTAKKNKGLGLAIVKTIVLEHGGDIKCVKASGGVQFEIQLPLAKGKL